MIMWYCRVPCLIHRDVDSASDLNKKKGELEQWLKNLGKRGEVRTIYLE